MKSNVKMTWAIAIIVALLAIGIYFLFSFGGNSPVVNGIVSNPESSDADSAESDLEEVVFPVEPDGGIGDTPQVFNLGGENFKFTMDGVDNPTLRVNRGDRVRIEFTSVSGFHDFVIDEFGATERVQEGESTFVEFIADQEGTFDYYCSVGSHRANGMEGLFIVE